jgi:hypothetical protein
MSAVVLVDTSVLLNVLDVPAFNQHREGILEQFERFVQEGSYLLLPMAAIFEAGNHISQLADGRLRRAHAERFVTAVRQAIDGNAPWQPLRIAGLKEIGTWMDEFADHAMRELGMGDLSIIKEWQAARVRHPHLRVMIWSLDAKLAAYDHRPAWHRRPF